RTIEDDTNLLRFDTTKPLPALFDFNPEGYGSDQLASAVTECMAGLCRFVREAFKATDPVLDEYKRYGVTYLVIVVFPDEQERWYRFDLTGNEPKIEMGEGKYDAAVPPDVMHRIVASALAARAAHEKSYFYLRAFSRKTCNVYALNHEDGKVRVEPQEL